MITISLNDRWCTDERYVRFYDCPKCGFERVPYAHSWYEHEEPSYEYTAKFCPGCGEEITWE